MKILLVAVSLLSSLCSYAHEAQIEKFETRIVDADENRFYLEAEGRVLRLGNEQKEELKLLKQAFQSGDVIRIEFESMDRFDLVHSIEVLPAGRRLELEVAPRDEFLDQFSLSYSPSDLGSYEVANRLFRSLETDFRRKSECYQRAEIWTYGMDTRSNVKSMKVFLFFTRRYIRQYDYKWWFHVSPFVLAGGVEYTMDRSFTSRPLLMKEWTDRFMLNRAECPTVDRYVDYSQNQESEHCYLRKVPMYYYQPLNVQAMDNGTSVSGWGSWELKHASRALR